MNPIPNALPEGSESNAVKASGADKLGYQIAVGDLPGIKDTSLPGWKTFDELRQDIWTSAYRPDPEMVPVNELKKTHQPNGKVMAAVMKSEFWSKLHEDTKFDELKSAEATVILSEKLPEILKEWPRDPNQPSDSDQDGDGELDENGEPKQQGEPDPNAAPQDLQQKIDDALKDTQKELKENDQMLESAGAGKGAGDDLNAKERVDLAKELRASGVFQKLAKMVGRMTLAASGIRASQYSGRTCEVGGFELSDNIMAAVPSELMLLKNKKTRMLFFKKFAERQLLCRELHSDESLERGPMVVCLDRSGSMASHIGGRSDQASRFDWGKAVTLALMSICRKQKRGLTLITFTEVAAVTFRAPSGRLTGKQLLNVARMGPTGGTCFNRALTLAFEEISTKHNMKQADIVFVTDGEDTLDHVPWVKDAAGNYLEDPKAAHPNLEKIVQQKETLNVRVWGVQVESGCSDKCLTSFSDKTAKLSDEKGVLDMIFGKATS